jgi:hypothetical protein
MKDKIKEAHRYANWQLFKHSIDKPFIVMHFNANSYPADTTQVACSYLIGASVVCQQ